MPPRLRADLAVMAGYHSPQVDVAARLNTNESPYPPPPGFMVELAAAVEKLPLNRYPDRAAAALREELAGYCGVDAGAVFAGHGSNEVLLTLLLAFGGPGRRALVFTPTYALHTHIAEMTGTTVVRAPRDADFRVGPGDVSDALAAHRPDVVFFCHPNNPTGNAERFDAVAAALDAAPDALVVVDEAYAEFAGESVVGWVGRRANLAVVRTLSKAWSLAGLRIGYVVAAPGIVDLLEPAHLPYHVDAVAQAAGVLALRYPDEMRARVDALVAGRRPNEEGLAALPGVRAWPSEANFVLFRPAGDAEVVWQGLLDRGVLVRDFAGNPETPNCLRVNVGTPEENEMFLDALAAALADVGT